jgi:hypothetical protein
MAKDKYSRSVKNSQGGGGDFVIFDLSKNMDIKVLKYKENLQTTSLDIVPFKIGGKHHPDVASGEAEIGDEDYILDIKVHRSIGPKKTNLICPRTYGKSCPICDYLDSIKNVHGWDSAEFTAVKKYNAQRKAVYFVVDPNSSEKKIQLFESSYANFQKELLEQAQADGAEEGLDIIPFAEWPKGCTIKFRVNMVKNGGSPFPYPEYKNFKFVARKGTEYPKDFLDDVPSLDELMIIHSHDDIEAMFNGEADEESDDPFEEEKEESPVPSKTKTRPIEEEKDDTEDEQKCPSKGGRFGVTVDDLKECGRCELGDACSAAYRANSRKSK